MNALEPTPCKSRRPVDWRSPAPASGEGGANRGGKAGKASFDVRSKMNAQSTAVAFGKNLKVAAGLRRLYHSEGVLLPGHRKIGGIVTRDLQEHAGIRAAFISLAGRMEKAESKTEARGDAAFVADKVANRLKLGLVGPIAIEIAEQRKVIAGRSEERRVGKECRSRWSPDH